jgi:hypothetical protein
MPELGKIGGGAAGLLAECSLLEAKLGIFKPSCPTMPWLTPWADDLKGKQDALSAARMSLVATVQGYGANDCPAHAGVVSF